MRGAAVTSGRGLSEEDEWKKQHRRMRMLKNVKMSFFINQNASATAQRYHTEGKERVPG